MLDNLKTFCYYIFNSTYTTTTINYLRERNTNMNDTLQLIINEALEAERKENGKRFSTHYEAQARIKAQFDNAMDSIRLSANAIDTLWNLTRQEEFGENYTNSADALKRQILYSVYNLLGQYVLLEKLDEGDHLQHYEEDTASGVLVRNSQHAEQEDVEWKRRDEIDDKPSRQVLLRDGLPVGGDRMLYFHR